MDIIKKRKKGWKLTEKRKKQLSEAHFGDKNPMWRGDKVGYISLHEWVKKYLLKPELCQECGKEQPRDLANKGTYNRDLSNWEWLCRRCHMIKDGRIKNLRQYSTENEPRLYKGRELEWRKEYWIKNKERIKKYRQSKNCGIKLF